MSFTQSSAPRKVQPCLLCGRREVAEGEVLYSSRLPSALTAQHFSARRQPDRYHYQLVRCRRDGLVRSTPVFDEDTLQQLYSGSQVTYGQEQSSLIVSYLRVLEKTLVTLPQGAKILEIGCGDGFLLAALAELGFEVYGVEPGTPAWQQAPAALRKRIKNEMFVANSWQPNSFDLVMCFQTLDHLPNPLQFASDAHGLLKKGGWLVSLHHNVEAWPVRLLGERHPIIDVEHTYLFSPATSRALWRRAGFRSVLTELPWNSLSLRHLCHLLPLPVSLKSWLSGVRRGPLSTILNMTISLPLGNISLYGRK
jgi:SAM-dependent methyltransferase